MSLLQQLTGGDRRSIQGVPTVVDEVLADPALFSVVFDGMADADPLVRMRCADAVEKITAVRPECLTPYKKRVLRLAALAEQPEVRWHLAQLLSRLDLSAAERRRAVGILTEYLTDTSSIVKTFAMQALADIAIRDSELRAPITEQLKRLTRTGSPAMKSRGKRLLARLNQSVIPAPLTAEQQAVRCRGASGASSPMFAIKAEVNDPGAAAFVFSEQKTMYDGKHIAKGDTIFVFASENEGGPGLIASGIVTSAEASPRKPGIARQTPRVSITIRRTALAKRRLGRSELKSFSDWNDGRPETELNFKFYRQATNKIVGISDEAAVFLRGFF